MRSLFSCSTGNRTVYCSCRLSTILGFLPTCFYSITVPSHLHFCETWEVHVEDARWLSVLDHQHLRRFVESGESIAWAITRCIEVHWMLHTVSVRLNSFWGSVHHSAIRIFCTCSRNSGKAKRPPDHD